MRHAFVSFSHRFVLGIVTVASLPQVAWPQAGVCALQPFDGGTVRAVQDGRTFVLEDGRDIRLAGIELPPRDGAAGAAAKAALEALLPGRAVVLKHLRAETDRYGRPLAYAFLPGDDRPVQLHLLAQGQARVAARVGHAACAAELLAAERAARAAGIGLWGRPQGAVARAEDPAGVLAQQGRFALVEGPVLSVREFRGVIYVNFGRRWSEDFTVTVLKRNERAFTAAGMDLKRLAGQTVRVRGVVEERSGPWIEATAPEQIEIAERK